MWLRREQNAERRKGRATQGFSLIELLIVIAVILIVAAIAIPSFIQSRMRANEASAVSGLRSITTAEISYATTYNVGYSATLAALGGTGVLVDQNGAGLIDSVLSSGLKSGYSYSYVATSSDPNGNVVTYTVNADPTLVGTTGTGHYYVDQTSIIRVNTTAPASVNDTPVN